MRFVFYSFLVLLPVLSTADASWWSSNEGSATSTSSGNDVENYTSWSPERLRAWLEVHHVSVPSSAAQSQSDLQALVAENWDRASRWTYDQYESAQHVFSEIRDDMFDKWDESQLRQFLLQQGIVAPKGPKEHLVLLAKARYQSYKNAASSLASQSIATASTVGESASSWASAASTAVVQAAKDVFRPLNDAKDYVYSSWSDNQLRSYLEKGLLKPKDQKTREELLAMMRDAYAAVTEPIYDAWSDSAMHDWLVAHGVIKSDSEKDRERLRTLMNRYYYHINDAVWSTWSDSQLKQWLVDHGFVKSDARLTRDKMVRMVSDNYLVARDTLWDAWSDSDIRDWLVQNGYLRSDAQVKRDELVKLVDDKYNDYSGRVAAYLTWPDARLRVYLREKGIGEEYLPKSRPGLLQETRIRWIQVHNKAEAAFNKIREIVNEGVYKAEEGLNRVLSVITGTWNETKEQAVRGYDKASEAGHEAYEKAQEGYAAYKGAAESMKYKYERAKEDAYEEVAERAQHGKEWAGEKVSEAEEGASKAREAIGESMKQAGQKLKGEL
ncbi:hypothetical protein AX15_007141 [Amanita polypyramis BW_CC]|nr:hypothetical protein AX15_007141 [Amanita polypyramis BW_CC]